MTTHSDSNAQRSCHTYICTTLKPGINILITMLACDLVIPPRPKRLSSTATEAEKQVRDALMKESKRCQDCL